MHGEYQQKFPENCTDNDDIIKEAMSMPLKWMFYTVKFYHF